MGTSTDLRNTPNPGILPHPSHSCGSYDDPNPYPTQTIAPWPDNTFAWTDNVDDVVDAVNVSLGRKAKVHPPLFGTHVGTVEHNRAVAIKKAHLG